MDLAANMKALETRIQAACGRAHRDAATVQILAVSKGQPPEKIQAAAELGLMVFGENRIQEAKAKIGRCASKLRWHMIGHLQSNKCRDAVHFFEMIQSVDSLEIAQEINKSAEKAAKTMAVLLEVNVVGEASKFGFSPEELLAHLSAINTLRKIEIHGLMTIAPWTPEPEKVRPVFRRLRELKKECEGVLGAPLPQLSMGMSGDFEVAIEEGATLVRIGTGLFGTRDRAKDFKPDSVLSREME